MAQAKAGLGELEESERLFELALTHAKHYPTCYPGFAEVFEAYARLLKLMNRDSDAAAMEERARALLQSAGAR
jgi:hypothetical protein